MRPDNVDLHGNWKL